MQEWNITCKENQWLLALVGTAHFAGIVIGSAAAGVFADKYVIERGVVIVEFNIFFTFRIFFSYGRKKVFILSTQFMAITGIGQAISTNYITFTIFALLNAVGTAGVFPLAFIIGMV